MNHYIFKLVVFATQGVSQQGIRPLAQPLLILLFNFILNILFIYLTEIERERERVHKHGEQQAEGEGEAGSPLSREPNVGLDSRALRS